MKNPDSLLRVLCAISFVLILSTASIGSAPIPNPVLVFTGSEPGQGSSSHLTRYKLEVFNKEDFPSEMFVPAPTLPPCGKNTKASRTWVDIYDQSGHRLNGFCAINSPAQLNDLWFNVESDQIPPSWIYIEMTDRQTNTKYKSNLVETVL